MPVTIVGAEKAPLIMYVLMGIVLLIVIGAIIAFVRLFVRCYKYHWHSFIEETAIAAWFALVGSVIFYFGCQYIYDSPPQDLNLAYANTSYSGQFILEGSSSKGNDLINGTTSKEKRLLYSGSDLEKTINGNKYYIFKLDDIKSDKESVEEIVEKYNTKYGKNIKTEDLIVVKSDRY